MYPGKIRLWEDSEPYNIRSGWRVLARWHSWLEYHPIHQKSADLIPSQGTYLGYRFNPWSGCIWEATDWCFTSMFLFTLPSSLSKISKTYSRVRIKKGKERKKELRTWKSNQEKKLSEGYDSCGKIFCFKNCQVNRFGLFFELQEKQQDQWVQATEGKILDWYPNVERASQKVVSTLFLEVFKDSLEEIKAFDGRLKDCL